MSGLERIKDFLRWMGEVDAGLWRASPPRTALGVENGVAVKYVRAGDGYHSDGPAASGDRGPIYLSESNALNATVSTSVEAALYGPSAARIEAAKACPFPLEEGAAALIPSPAPWGPDGAKWVLAAAPRAKIDEIHTALVSAGARPGEAFALVNGAPAPMHSKRGFSLLAAAAIITLIAAIGAAISVSYGAARIEGAAEARLAAARKALDAAEVQAADAASRREAAAGPLRQAQIVGAALDRAPSVAARLADLVEATPDTAYLKRLTIRPDLISGEFIAPDAAALAARIGAAPGFTAARLKGPARTEAAGLQRATLDITPEAPE